MWIFNETKIYLHRKTVQFVNINSKKAERVLLEIQEQMNYINDLAKTFN